MGIDATNVLTIFLSSNRGPDPINPEKKSLPVYGVNAFLEGDLLTVELTFEGGSPYCCDEFDYQLCFSVKEGVRYHHETHE